MTAGAIRGPIARGTIRTTFVLGLRLAVQAGTLLIVARMLGPHLFGAFAGVAALAVMLGTLSSFGSNVVLLGEVSKKSSRREHVLRYAVPGTLLCGSALLGVYLIISKFALHETDLPLSVLLAIGVTETLLQPLFTLPAAEHLALGRIARSQLLTMLPLALRLAAAATVFALQLAEPLSAYALGYLVASLVALAAATATMPARWPTLRAWRLPNRAELWQAAGFAALNITATTPAELDKTLAAKLLPLSAAGLYAAGARVVGAATLPVIAMMLSALPRLFREGLAKPHRTARLIHRMLAAALVYSIALAVLLWFAAPGFAWVFGAQYAGIQHTVRWLCLAVPGMALRMAAGSILMALGKPWLRVAFEIIGLVALLVTATTLTMRFGTGGMPLALACSEWAMAAIGLGSISATTRKADNQ